MGRRRANTNYEDLRTARILENQARLASLGIQKSIAALRSLTSLVKPKKAKPSKKVHPVTSLRRSVRLLTSSTRNRNPKWIDVRQSDRLGGKKLRPRWRKQSSSFESSLSSNFSTDDGSISEEVESRVSTRGRTSRFANKTLVKSKSLDYDQIFGIWCHFCRLKKLCDDEECKRCRNLDIYQPCIGKTECSLCHSSNGVLCRACLKVWCGKDIEDVRENAEWICPCCVQEARLKPFWICKRFHLLRKFIKYEEAKNDADSSITSNLESSGDEIQISESDTSVSG